MDEPPMLYKGLNLPIKVKGPLPHYLLSISKCEALMVLLFSLIEGQHYHDGDNSTLESWLLVIESQDPEEDDWNEYPGHPV